MNTALVRASDVNLDDLQRTAKMMVVSGYFDAARDANQAIAQIAVKILAGREMGYGPFASVQGIHVIQGKPTLSANLLAAAVKAHPHYDYRVRQMTDDVVSLEFFQDGQSIGSSEFTATNAKDAGLTGKDIWRKFPRNMLFARALSNGVRWYCPDVFNGNAVYVPEELGATVDGETGEIIEAPKPVVQAAQVEVEQKPTPTPTPKPAPKPDAQAINENELVGWAVGLNRFTGADDALSALRDQRAKFPNDTLDAFKVHWRDYVISLPILQAEPPADEAPAAEDDPFDKPPSWRTPKEAQAWAVTNGHCQNEHEAANSWMNEVKAANGFSKANANTVYEAFYRKHMGRQLQAA